VADIGPDRAQLGAQDRLRVDVGVVLRRRDVVGPGGANRDRAVDRRQRPFVEHAADRGANEECGADALVGVVTARVGDPVGHVVLG
jgi:hypothetical protein